MDRVLREEYGAGTIKLPGYKNREGVMEFVHPSQEEIEVHHTDFLAKSLNLWRMSKWWGLPNNKGWDNEKATVMDILNILENESNRYDSWEFENKGN